MKSDHLIAELTENLHRHGVKYRPAELDAFASGLPEPACDLDAATLTRRFLQAQQAHVRRERFRDYTRGVIGGGAYLLLVGLSGLVELLQDKDYPTLESSAETLWLGLIMAGSLVCAGTLLLRLWRFQNGRKDDQAKQLPRRQKE